MTDAHLSAKQRRYTRMRRAGLCTNGCGQPAKRDKDGDQMSLCAEHLDQRRRAMNLRNARQAAGRMP